MKYIIIFITLIYPNLVYALSAPKPAERISIAVSPALPPYVLSDSDSGLQLQILKAALHSQGLTDVDIVYMSNKRAEQALHQGLVDIAMNHSQSNLPGIFASTSLLSYQNVAVSLKSRDYQINSVYDLSGKSVLAFVNAPEFLPPPFKAITKKLKSYDEVINQAAQIDHLLKGWTDVIVLEKRVFFYYLQKYDIEQLKFFKVHAIFPTAPRPAFFNSKVLQEVFDLGLAHIIENGEYRAIMAFDEYEYAQTTPTGANPHQEGPQKNQFN